MKNVKEQRITPAEKQPDKRLLTGKAAIITGGAYGIGRAIAAEFLQEGAKVAIFDSNEKRLRQTTQELTPFGTIYSYNVDVRDKDAIKKALADVEGKMGQIDMLVNNAGESVKSCV